MRKKLITLGLGLAIVTSVGIVSANDVTTVSGVENGAVVESESELTPEGFFGGTSKEEMLERRAEVTGLTVEELEEQFQGMGRRGGGMNGASECDPEILAERAAEAGLTVDEFQAQQEIDREAFRAERRQQMADQKGVSVDELGAGSQGKGRGMSNRF